MQISEKEFLSENPHWVPNVAQDATLWADITMWFRPVVVKLFCIGTHFSICSKTCAPLPCTKIYYCKSAKFLCCRRCL